jgi:hypothetical protein
MQATAQSPALVDRVLRTSDPWLPLVASQAAIEFDKAAQGIPVVFHAAPRLVEFLRSSLNKPAATADATRGLDIGTVGIVGRALDESWKQTQTVSDIVAQAWEVAESMASTTSGPPAATSTENAESGPTLDQLRKFCVALANSLITYRGSLREGKPVSPYRR